MLWVLFALLHKLVKDISTSFKIVLLVHQFSHLECNFYMPKNVNWNSHWAFLRLCLFFFFFLPIYLLFWRFHIFFLFFTAFFVILLALLCLLNLYNSDFRIIACLYFSCPIWKTMYVGEPIFQDMERVSMQFSVGIAFMNRESYPSHELKSIYLFEGSRFFRQVFWNQGFLYSIRF